MSIFQNPIVLLKQKNVNLHGGNLFRPTKYLHIVYIYKLNICRYRRIMQWAMAQDTIEWNQGKRHHTSQQGEGHSPNRFRFESTNWYT